MPDSDLQTLAQIMQLAAPQADPQTQQRMMMMYHQQQLQQQAAQHRDEIGFRRQELAQRQSQFDYAKQQAEQDKRMQLAQQMIDTNLRMGKPTDSPEILALLQEFGPMGERVREGVFQSHADKAVAGLQDYLQAYQRKPSREGFATLNAQLSSMGMLHPEVQKYIPWEQVNAGIPRWESGGGGGGAALTEFQQQGFDLLAKMRADREAKDAQTAQLAAQAGQTNNMNHQIYGEMFRTDPVVAQQQLMEQATKIGLARQQAAQEQLKRETSPWAFLGF